MSTYIVETRPTDIPTNSNVLILLNSHCYIGIKSDRNKRGNINHNAGSAFAGLGLETSDKNTVICPFHHHAGVQHRNVKQSETNTTHLYTHGASFQKNGFIGEKQPESFSCLCLCSEGHDDRECTQNISKRKFKDFLHVAAFISVLTS